MAGANRLHQKAMRWLVDNGIPSYGAPDTAVNGMAALREYYRMQAMLKEPLETRREFDHEAAIKIIEHARADGHIP